jgi:four helix bundle protein
MDTIRWQDGEKVFAEAHELASRLYRSTRDFPICEGKGLVYEMRQSTLAVSAFLSDALRKSQRNYLLDVMSAIDRHLAKLRRQLAVSRLLTYLAPSDFEDLDRRVETLAARIAEWRGALEEVPELRLRQEASPR